MTDNTIAELTTNIVTPEELVKITYNGEDRLVYPEIAAFVNAMDGANRERMLKRAEINKAYFEAEYAAQLEYLSNPANNPDLWDSYERLREQRRLQRAALQDADQVYSDLVSARAYSPQHRHNPAHRNLWAELHDTTTRPVVRWIIERCRAYEHEASIILKHLPNSIDRLWEVAKEDNDMCSVFDDFMAQADRAGVLEGLDVHVPASSKERIALRSYIRRNYGSGYTRDLMPRIDRIVKAELDAAKAEWQKLDEAHAENVHHNRSAGARRAAETRRRNREAAESAQADVVSLIKETNTNEAPITA